MKTATLSLQTLHLLSEGLTEDFLQQIENAVADCRQRPTLPDKREVTIKLTIVPHPEDPDDVLISPVTTRKTPARKVEPIRARRTKRNQLQFDFLDDDFEGEEEAARPSRKETYARGLRKETADSWKAVNRTEPSPA